MYMKQVQDKQQKGARDWPASSEPSQGPLGRIESQIQPQHLGPDRNSNFYSVLELDVFKEHPASPLFAQRKIANPSRREGLFSFPALSSMDLVPEFQS